MNPLDPTYAIFLKSWGFKDVKYDILMCQSHSTRSHTPKLLFDLLLPSGMLCDTTPQGLLSTLEDSTSPLNTSTDDTQPSRIHSDPKIFNSVSYAGQNFVY